MKIPKITQAEVMNMATLKGVSDTPFIVGIRGYYKDTMGKPGVNDRGIYDDAIIVVGDKTFAAFQANVDPSIFRKGIATLVEGVYECVKWMHKGKYAALQIVRDRVHRDGTIQGAIDEGRHGINIHYGGESQTWSEGCQTLPKSTYSQFLNLVYSEMKNADIDRIKYVLIEN